MTLDTTLSITIAMSMVLALVITKAVVSGWWRAPETWIVGLPVIMVVHNRTEWTWDFNHRAGKIESIRAPIIGVFPSFKSLQWRLTTL